MARAESTAHWQRKSSAIAFSPEVPTLLVFAALILAAPVDLYLAYRVFTSDARFASLIALLIIGAMLGLVMLAVSQSRQGIVGSFETDASDRVIHDEVVRLFAPAGWSLNGSTEREVWYSHENGPRPIVIGLLLLFGVFPALVYLVVARNEQVAHISWHSMPDGWKRVDVGVTPQNPNGRAIVTWLHRQLDA